MPRLAIPSLLPKLVVLAAPHYAQQTNFVNLILVHHVAQPTSAERAQQHQSSALSNTIQFADVTASHTETPAQQQRRKLQLSLLENALVATDRNSLVDNKSQPARTDKLLKS